MKINKINYKVFGKLENMELLFTNTLNVILGVNEAGKSTIFNSILSLIYGFKPSSRDKHPYTNWEKNEILFSGEIVESSELFVVERSLKSVPKFSLLNVDTNNVKTYRNDAIPFVKNVSEMLYESVFHLSADQLSKFEKESWESIQEKLIFNYGTDYLIKTSEVMSRLEQDINALWRKDKRGNPQINQLQAEISALKMKRHDVEKIYDLAKIKNERLESIQAEMDVIGREKSELNQLLKQHRDALPIKELKEKIELIHKSVYNETTFLRLSPKILEDIEIYQQRISELTERKEQLEEEVVLIERSLKPYSEQDLKLLDLNQDHDYLTTLLEDLMKLEHDEHLKLDELMKTKEKSANQFRLLFNIDLTENLNESLKKIQVLDLMSSLQKYAENHEKNIEIEKRIKLSYDANRKMNLIIGVMGVLLGILGLINNVFVGISFIGVAMIGYSIAKFKPTKKDDQLELFDLKELEHSINDAMHGIELPNYVWGDESQRFLSKLEQLIMTLFEEDSLEQKRLHILEQKKALESKIELHLSDYGIDTSRGAHLTLQFTIAQMDHLSKSDIEENKKKTKIEALRDRLISVQTDIIKFDEPLRELIGEVERFGDGDYQFGLNQINQNRELIMKMKLYEDELKRFDCDPSDIEDVSMEIIETLEVERIQLFNREKMLIEEKHQVINELSKYTEMMNLEEIDSNILIKEERLVELIEKRNQLMILNEIVKFSDERFRLQNQPNIINRVSYFMSKMTKGKYSEVLINEQMELQFLVGGEILPISKAFSKGTIQQLFFAYRLAIIEALDPDYALPLVLDEAFVNWDIHRFLETIDIISEISKKRQIFVFTCHHNVADLIKERTNCNLLEVSI